MTFLGFGIILISETCTEEAENFTFPVRHTSQTFNKALPVFIILAPLVHNITQKIVMVCAPEPSEILSQK